MHKCIKMVVFTVLVVLSLQQIAFANEETKRPPKPTEGIESSDPNHGSSTDSDNESVQRASGLFYNYYCSIDNTGSDLYLEGSTVANYLSDQVKLTLYLQIWDGSQWIDVQSWPFTQYNSKSVTEGANTSFQHGNYYRTRAVHYIKYGTQTETQNSTSSYIYVD
ncbi:hypothetical protein CDQ84_18750 [Clostridium thermosuccinogenes]|uniref:Uncharacterized protein n=1 Tax=Clostridium thermosuccinogenes TaxID=84032 RepID=A0A2K2EZ87_9CLOT|nr:hypothetical protein [Pseudoclostridium thermosuccinogenes]AUS96074.1 hypothetical protein CDO33_06255 [Pseudoclostridium thermosuccinogenes]PNT91840.1 hypothetical protein CDQ85_18650 [Pseudoclostridium thermosuccinogenes]PNT94575.1 hypothetical protein CDQ84_18750 [Pseudoclostridium thermosuccinogenes]